MKPTRQEWYDKLIKAANDGQLTTDRITLYHDKWGITVQHSKYCENPSIFYKINE